jgi:hypothetical protein
MLRVATCRKNSRTCLEEKSDFMYTLVKYNYYFDIILVYKKILHTGGNCSIKRDARALLSLCSLYYVSCLRERYQIYIKPKTSDATTPSVIGTVVVLQADNSRVVVALQADDFRQFGCNRPDQAAENC